MSTKVPFPPSHPLKRLFCSATSPPPRSAACWEICGDSVEIDLAQAPELKAPGGALRLDGVNLPDRVLVVHGIDGIFRSYRNRCACGGFRIDPVPGEQKIRCCTLMQSTYDYDGKRLSGMDERELDVLPVEAGQERLIIDITSLREPAPHKRK